MRYAQSPTLSREDNDGDIAARVADGVRDSFDERVGSAAEDQIHDPRIRWPRSNSRQRASIAANNRIVGRRPSLAKRMLHGTARFLLAVLIGIGATLSWQSYGAQAQKIIGTRYPSLAWLAALSPTPSDTATPSSPDAAAQPSPLAVDLSAVRHEVEQLAINQGQLNSNEDQIARTVAAIQATELEVDQKVSAIAEPKPVHLSPRRSAQRLAPTSIAPER